MRPSRSLRHIVAAAACCGLLVPFALADWPCPADVDADGVIDVDDLLFVLGTFGSPDGDLNGDGATNLDDLLIVLEAWGPCLENDEISGATQVFAGSNPYDTTGSTPIEAIPSGCDTSGSDTNVIFDIWHYYVASESGFLELSTCADEGCGGSATFDTDLYVYGPFAEVGAFPPDDIVNDPDALNVYLLGCNDDAGACANTAGGWYSYLQVPVMAGQTYLVRNGGWQADVDFGPGDLFLCETPDVLAQVCVGRIPVDVGDVATGDTSESTVFDDAAAIDCGSMTNSPGLWYSIIGDGSTYTLTTCFVGTAYDTLVTVYCSTCSDPVCVAVDDDDPGCFDFSGASTLCWPTVAGTEYFIFVNGDGQGAFSMQITNDGTGPACTPSNPDPVACGPPANDSWETPVAIAEADFPLHTDTTLATTDGPTHPECDQDGDGGVTVNDIWFALTPSVAGDLTISVCQEDGGDADYDTDLVLYDGCGDPAALPIAQCNDDAVNPCTSGTVFGSRLEDVPVAAGSCYLLRVGGWAPDERGTATLAGTIAP